MADDAFHVTLQVANALESLGIPYAIGGSLASSLHGVMRATLDADIVADIPQEKVEQLISSLTPAFYADETMIREALQRRVNFNLIHMDTAFKVDVVIPKSRPFDRNQLRRGEAARIAADPEAELYVISAEDVVLAKLDWFRQGGEVVGNLLDYK